MERNSARAVYECLPRAPAARNKGWTASQAALVQCCRNKNSRARAIYVIFVCCWWALRERAAALSVLQSHSPRQRRIQLLSRKPPVPN